MSTETKTLDHFYEMHVKHQAGGGYMVYWRSPICLDPKQVPMAAVADGNLGAFDLENIEYCLEITAEEYFEHMDS
jgi:hypothetical protein